MVWKDGAETPDQVVNDSTARPATVTLSLYTENRGQLRGG